MQSARLQQDHTDPRQRPGSAKAANPVMVGACIGCTELSAEENMPATALKKPGAKHPLRNEAAFRRGLGKSMKN